MRILMFAIASFILVGCASKPDDISTSYVSPMKYSKYDCDQIIMEMDYVSNRTADLYQSLNKKADNDAWQMGLGMVLFLPTLFFLEGGDGPEATEYAQLKGEYKALHQTAVSKKCGLENLPKSPEEIIAEEEAQKQTGPEAQEEADKKQAESKEMN